jgi:hypothetical protein
MIIDEKLNLIKGKIEALIERNNGLVAEKDKYLEEISSLRQQLEEKEKFIKELENKTVNLQITNTVEDEEKTRLKVLIEDYITEIDKALELLKS